MRDPKPTEGTEIDSYSHSLIPLFLLSCSVPVGKTLNTVRPFYSVCPVTRSSSADPVYYLFTPQTSLCVP